MESEDEILQRLAKDGSMDFSTWGAVLPNVIQRIETIAHTQFPVPNLPDPPAARTPVPRFHMPIPSSDPIAPTDSTPSSQETDKENALPSSSVGITSVPTSSRPRPAVPALLQPPIAPGDLPGPIARLLDEITSTLRNNFDRYPPHTIQRLSELVLQPKRHYRSLTAYLHALDRVVHVTSGNNIYPLPPAVPNMSQMSLLANGVGGNAPSALQINTAAANSLGSDESLGGALLTPIPWLARRANGGSEDGVGSSEDGSTSSPVSTHSHPAVGSNISGQQEQHISQSQPSQQLQPEAQTQTAGLQRSSLSPAAGIDSSTSSSSSSIVPRPEVRTESTETIEGPNGIGSIETVSVSVNGVPSTGAGGASVLASRGVTQGELLRQEQRAGVVPLSQLVRQAQQQQAALVRAQGGGGASVAAAEDAETDDDKMDADGGADASMGQGSDGKEEGVDEDVPHARGPSEIDDVDTGPQAGSGGATHFAVGSTSASGQPLVKLQGIDVEAAVGRKVVTVPTSEEEEKRRASPGDEIVPQSPKREAEDELEGQGKKAKTSSEEGETEGEEADAMTVDEPVGAATSAGEEAEPETDAEGDVVIEEPVPVAQGEKAAAASKPEAAVDG